MITWWDLVSLNENKSKITEENNETKYLVSWRSIKYSKMEKVIRFTLIGDEKLKKNEKDWGGRRGH